MRLLIIDPDEMLKELAPVETMPEISVSVVSVAVEFEAAIRAIRPDILLFATRDAAEVGRVCDELQREDSLLKPSQVYLWTNRPVGWCPGRAAGLELLHEGMFDLNDLRSAIMRRAMSEHRRRRRLPTAEEAQTAGRGFE